MSLISALLLGMIALALAGTAQAETVSTPLIYARIAHKHALAPSALYQAALTASGRSPGYGAPPAPWPWTIKICTKPHDKHCNTVHLQDRKALYAVAKAALGAGQPIYLGPLGFGWRANETLPLWAATQPLVSINAWAQRQRLEVHALGALNTKKVSAAPGPAQNTARARRYTPLINRIAQAEGVDPALVHAVVSVESAYNPNAVSHAGAMGLMQLMPQTAERFGLARTERTDPTKNLRAGIRYLKFLQRYFNGDLTLMLAGYHAGEGAVDRYGRQIPPYRETQQYVRKVTRLLARYQTSGAS